MHQMFLFVEKLYSFFKHFHMSYLLQAFNALALATFVSVFKNLIDKWASKFPIVHSLSIDFAFKLDQDLNVG